MQHSPVLESPSAAGLQAPSTAGEMTRDKVLGLTLRQWAIVSIAITILSPLLISLSRGPLMFDDAFMFYRYALHVREGHGIAWNADGVQTYGLTSHLWLLGVLPLTFLPVSPSAALQLGSALAGTAAVVVTGLAVARNARSKEFCDRTVAISAVALPLLLNPLFAYHLTTGMDTMLSMAMHGAVLMTVLRYAAAPGPRHAVIVGLTGFAAVLARPENGLCALAVPAFVFLVITPPKAFLARWRDAAGLVLLPLGLIAVEIALCTLVFGVPLPLGFYAKALHAYAGFQNPENAVLYLMLALTCALPYLAVLIVVAKRRDVLWLGAIVLPAVLTVLYLLTTRQVMGWGGRYFIPFLPYVVVPALLLLDRALADGEHWLQTVRRAGIRLLVVLAVFVATLPLQRAVEAAYMRAILAAPIAVPALPVAATATLPQRHWFTAIEHLGDGVIAKLPPRTVVAASEVGYLGMVAPNVDIVDLVGLNDTTIGRQGFSMDYLLARAPELIWMPASDYTGLVARIYSDPRLFERYVVIKDAFNYGLAIRRDGPNRARIEALIAAAWPRLYPRHRLADYIVRDPG